MTALRPSKIIGIGRNYVAHAKELGNEMPAVPIIFFKPPTSLIGDGDTIRLAGRLPESGVRGGDRRGDRLTGQEPEPGRGGARHRRVHLRQRRHLPRPPEGGRPVGPGQGIRHLLPGGAARGAGARLARPRDHLPGERGGAPARPGHRHALSDSRPGVVPERHHDARARRPHRHRHAGRYRRRSRTAIGSRSRSPASACSPIQ